MKVGDQAVQHAKLVSGIDKDIRFSTTWLNGTVFLRNRLQSAAAGGSHSKHPSALCFGFVDQIGGFF